MLEQRLENWGAALRVGGIRYGSTGSLEGNWRSPQPWDAPIGTKRPALDMHDAIAIESAVCALPLFDHLLLKAWYVARWSPGKCLGVAARKGSMQERMSFAVAMTLAEAHLLAELDRPAVTRKARAVAYVRRALGVGPVALARVNDCV